MHEPQGLLQGLIQTVGDERVCVEELFYAELRQILSAITAGLSDTEGMVRAVMCDMCD